MSISAKNALIPSPLIAQKIYFVRGTRVMIDTDLARLYGVATKNLNKAVKRNADRFPADFMFQLSSNELQNLRFQAGTSKKAHGGRRYAPFVFTEQAWRCCRACYGASAVQVNVAIMRTFMRLREMLSTHEDLRRKIDAMEKRYDLRFQAVFDTIRQMLETPVPMKKAIGFHARFVPAAKSPRQNCV